jgi:ATP-dependent DNA helicase RecG
LGLKGKEITPAEIYTSMNTDDRDTYDKEVTYLRRIGVLEEIRNNFSAGQLARKLRVHKQKIGRFKIVVP